MSQLNHKALGHHAVISSRVKEPPERLDSSILDVFRDSVVPDVSDVVGRLYTMDSGIKPLYKPMKSVVGFALTVKAPPGDNWAIHGALSRVQQDDILVIDWRGYREGCGSGARTLGLASERGLVGLIVDGAWRDIDDIQDVALPVFGRGISPFSPSKQELGEINVPVCCGGVIVEPGDILVADDEGVAVIPRWSAEKVAHHISRTESDHSVESRPEHNSGNKIGRIAEAYFEAVSEQNRIGEQQ